MASPSNLRPKSSCGCEAFQSPRPRQFSHDVAQVSIPIQHARASAWTALRSSRSIVVLLMLFQPEHDVSSWHETDMPKYLGNVRCWVNSGKHVLARSFSGFDPKRHLHEPLRGLESKRLARDGKSHDGSVFIEARSRSGVHLPRSRKQWDVANQGDPRWL